jgi:hypothetical protein
MAFFLLSKLTFVAMDSLPSPSPFVSTWIWMKVNVWAGSAVSAHDLFFRASSYIVDPLDDVRVDV